MQLVLACCALNDLAALLSGFYIAHAKYVVRLTYDLY